MIHSFLAAIGFDVQHLLVDKLIEERFDGKLENSFVNTCKNE